MIRATLADIQRARQRIDGKVRRTPLVRSDRLSDLSGGEVHLKLESLQVTGSFKARGALNAVLASQHFGVGLARALVHFLRVGVERRRLRAWHKELIKSLGERGLLRTGDGTAI